MTQNEYKIIHGSFVQFGEDIILDLSKVLLFTFEQYEYRDKWFINFVFENTRYSIGSFNTKRAAKAYIEVILKTVFDFNQRPKDETDTCIAKVSKRQGFND